MSPSTSPCILPKGFLETVILAQVLAGCLAGPWAAPILGGGKKKKKSYAPGSQILFYLPTRSPPRIILLFQTCTSMKRLECGFLDGVRICLRKGPSASPAPAHVSLETSRKLWERAILSSDGGMRCDRAGGSQQESDCVIPAPAYPRPSTPFMSVPKYPWWD